MRKIAVMKATPSHWEGDSGVGEVVEMMIGRSKRSQATLDEVKVAAFTDEMKKIASHAMEVAGLGTLAAPHVYNAVTGKKPTHKTERNTELAGLGILAAPSVKALLSKAKHASVSKHAFSMANPFAFARSAKQGAQIASSMKGAGQTALKGSQKLSKNISNFVPPTQTGAGWGAQRTWQNNPRAISL